MPTGPRVDYRTDPGRYRHWKLTFDGPVATLAMDVAEDGGVRDGYKLKLNSYDLGVDIELHDAVQRIRFEHPEVRSVVITSGKDRVFCSGANIFMLGLSSHAWKVNFCKFTNETRNGLEDASRHSGLKFLAAINGACAGGGYELALACDRIMLVDDRSSSVALPEVPLLGVLPGTGGLTRVTDKRRVRHDLADIFCTLTEGVRGQRAVDWRLVDEIVKPGQFAQAVRERAHGTGANQPPAGRRARRAADRAGAHRRRERVSLQPRRRRDRPRRAHRDVHRPGARDAAARGHRRHRGRRSRLVAAGAGARTRRRDPDHAHQRTRHRDLAARHARRCGRRCSRSMPLLERHESHWLVRETIGFLRRTLARLDVSSRTLFALIERESCFAGTLLELALAADRSYMQRLPGDAGEPRLAVSAQNFGAYPMVNGKSRLAQRFYDDESALACCAHGRAIGLSVPDDAERLGLVTATPDDLDWDDEIRIALEERASMSPDALTGMEANLRFGGAETMETRIFGRLSAWQNWIFIRPNAVGEKGALKVYGKGGKAQFDFERV